ncbi:MAG: GNAT family N-acetyltransferase [Acidimicrobiales bacterium]|nr:GNAT family N-acetyltransferase [Acidimicrobiales bacterium]
MLIRPRRPADTDHLVDLATVIRARDAYPRVLLGELRHFIVSPEALAAFVAVDDETGAAANPLVGHVALHPRSTPPVMALARRATGRPEDQLALIARLMVDPQARRKGVGRRLLEAGSAAASALGRLPVLDVVDEDLAAIALYERCGWTCAGRVTVEFPGMVLDEFVYVSPGGVPE